MVNLNRKFGEKIKFIGINVAINEKIEGVQDYIKSNGIDFPNIFDRDKKNNQGIWSHGNADTHNH